jgi:hypothetical protein
MPRRNAVEGVRDSVNEGILLDLSGRTDRVVSGRIARDPSIYRNRWNRWYRDMRLGLRHTASEPKGTEPQRADHRGAGCNFLTSHRELLVLLCAPLTWRHRSIDLCS